MFFTRLVFPHSSLLPVAAIVAAVSFVAGRMLTENFRKSSPATERIESFAATDRVHEAHLG
jgi:hypothetical protein